MSFVPISVFVEIYMCQHSKIRPHVVKETFVREDDGGRCSQITSVDMLGWSDYNDDNDGKSSVISFWNSPVHLSKTCKVKSIEVISVYSLDHSGHLAGDESEISMTHFGMWKMNDDDYNRNWSYSEEKPRSNTDPNDDVEKKKNEKPNMVGVLEMVRQITFFSKCIYSQI